MKIIIELTEKEEECLIELHSRKGWETNAYTGHPKDDEFRIKYEEQLSSMEELFYHDNPYSESYWSYSLTEKGLEVQNIILNK